MSAFRGTPGPWTAERTFAPRGWNIEALDGAYTVGIARDGSSTPQNEANARLIAAAPELLEVLEHVRDAMEASGGWDGDEHVFELVVAAIAKATGGAA